MYAVLDRNVKNIISVTLDWWVPESMRSWRRSSKLYTSSWTKVCSSHWGRWWNTVSGYFPSYISKLISIIDADSLVRIISESIGQYGSQLMLRNAGESPWPMFIVKIFAEVKFQPNKGYINFKLPPCGWSPVCIHLDAYNYVQSCHIISVQRDIRFLWPNHLIDSFYMFLCW